MFSPPCGTTLNDQPEEEPRIAQLQGFHADVSPPQISSCHLCPQPPLPAPPQARGSHSSAASSVAKPPSLAKHRLPKLCLPCSWPCPCSASQSSMTFNASLLKSILTLAFLRTGVALGVARFRVGLDLSVSRSKCTYKLAPPISQAPLDPKAGSTAPRCGFRRAR